MPSYCEYVRSPKAHPIHKWYHDHEHGFPARDDNALFERLMLEINQAGLSWDTVLRKLEHFRRAYDRFDVDAVAAYGDADRARLLGDPGIIRNRLKVNAAIENARRIVALRADYGSFAGWLEAHHPLSKDAWVKLFKQTFVFTGEEIVNEFLMSTGYLPGAHDEHCPIFERVAALRPAWMRMKR
ncbi:MAG: DNA-3-methyladenine glycosylase I [Candidatus Roseilinea sp.]|nr:MAG: DNA-3-methyladenine glycosylase I [Candidatus Roseilinea sp.]